MLLSRQLFLHVFIVTACLFVIGPFFASAKEPVASGIASVVQDGPCLSDLRREEIHRHLQQRIREMRAAGILASLKDTAVTYSWPVRPAQNEGHFAVYAITGFLDHDSDYEQLEDYNCGERTYDTPGYNHRGTDIIAWPFGWYKMDNDLVEIVAAADGVIIDKKDGRDDRSCGLSEANWNAIYLEHADGSVSWYGHFKKNSLTSKQEGESVLEGEFLGIMGSSGSSGRPHLHFELRNPAGQLVDAYSGPCNGRNAESLWTVQPPYYESGINALMTHSAPPVFPDCPETETLNEQTIFRPGEELYVAAYYRDHLSSQVSSYRILRPDGSVFEEWQHSPSEPYASASYYIWNSPLPADAPGGSWIFEVNYDGTLYEHNFEASLLTGVNTDDDRLITDYTLAQNYPNPFNPQTTISYTVPAAGAVKLQIFDSAGRLVETLVKAQQQAGAYNVSFDGSALPSGQYFYRLTGGEVQLTRTMSLIK